MFYSWQSDLPGNKTRYLIQESIDKAVSILKDTIKVEADRDTKNEFGSPDIVQTIFSKIEECDLFVADVSVVNKYTSLKEEIDEDGLQEYVQDRDDIRLTPNPNVLLELGYAAKTLGWDKIICIINTDFGEIEKLPFDIAHRRLTPYSLKKDTKANIKKELAGIIAETITSMMINGYVKKPLGNFSSHMVGSYDFELGMVVRKCPAITVRDLRSYKQLNDSLLLECKSLVENISKIQINPPEEKTEEDFVEEELNCGDQNIVTPLRESLSTLMKSNLFDILQKPKLVIIKEEDKREIQKNVKEHFGIDLEESFFCLGNLVSKPKQNFQGVVYDGTEDEKRKHSNFISLEYNFAQLKLLEYYMDTFNGMIFVPLAILNEGNINDEDISVIVKVDPTTAELVVPNLKLFNKSIPGLEGMVYEEELIKKIFLLPENDKVQYDTDISFDISDFRKIPEINIWGQTPKYDSEDYEGEIQKYIAQPSEYDNSMIEYNLRSLRPKEAKWLGSSILVKPLSDVIRITYYIKSCNSNGELDGQIELIVGE